MRLEKLVNSPEAERAYVHLLHSVGVDRLLQVRRLLRRLAETTGEQQEDRLLIQSSQCESQCARGGRIEPLDVVNCEDNWPLARESLQSAPDSDTERAQIEALRILLEEQCQFECVAPGRGQRRQYALDHVLEQVAETGVRQSSFRFRRPGHKDAESSLTGCLDTGKPQGRLPDPSFAFQRERSRSCRFAVEECLYGGELQLPPHDVDSHRRSTIKLRLTCCNRRKPRWTRPWGTRRPAAERDGAPVYRG